MRAACCARLCLAPARPPPRPSAATRRPSAADGRAPCERVGARRVPVDVLEVFAAQTRDRVSGFAVEREAEAARLDLTELVAQSLQVVAQLEEGT